MVNAGDALGYYTYLGEQAGHTYGFLAAAAASNGQTGNLWPDFLGHFANNFLENKAAEFGIAWSADKSRSLMLGLMVADFKARIRGTHT